MFSTQSQPHTVRTPDDEAELLEALRAGRDEAYEWLVRSHTGPMLAVAHRMLRGEEARDAVQEAFLAAFRSIPRFQGQCALSTWLYRIVVNACLMRLRSRHRKPETPFEDLLPTFMEDGHQSNPAIFWKLPGETDLERAELCQHVRECIEELPDTYRNVLLLRDIQELDTRETSLILGISENAVKIRVHRARQALRTLLEPFFREAGK
jgi:RNA polymerase sigma-70 factor, ECF subfamily